MSDKKNLEGNLNVILLKDIGESFIYKTDISFFNGLEWLRENGGKMKEVTIIPKRLGGSLKIPPSKSMAHRAIICAGLAGK